MARGRSAAPDAPEKLTLEPVSIGPTWHRDPKTGAWILPERTLGWAVLGWTAEYLRQPDGPDAGKPWRYTDEQARFMLWWYAVDEHGRFIYRGGMLRRVKGWGKDPVGATICASEFVGPCRFGGWDAAGGPVAIAHPASWVLTAAVAKDQTRNTMTLFPGLFSDAAISEYGIDLGKEIIYAHRGKCRLEAVTSSPRALEGPRASFVLKNEALALDTPIPTPSGWTTMGALQDGETIFGRNGDPVSVRRALPVQHGRKCYRVTFADGTSIVASDGHLWLTKVASSAAKPRVRATRELVADGRRFMVPRAGMRRTPNADLAVDPYLLGLWLGNGTSGDTNLTVGERDLEEAQRQLAARDVPTHVLAGGRAPRLGFSSRAGFGANMGTELAKALRQLDCFRGEKRIPREFLAAGHEQRLELLRGLMDSDGCASTTGQCIYVGTEGLTADVVELLRGLGQVTGPRSFTPDERSTRGGYWRVTFTARDIQPFAYRRKAIRVHQSSRDWLAITDIEEVESVPVRCIEVDADDQLFQAGDGGHVTHNTQHWLLNNDGLEMSKVIARNATKSRDGSSRVLAISNAHEPGEDSDAERDYEAWLAIQQGKSRSTGFMYDSLEAPPDTDLANELQLRAALVAARGDSEWLDEDRHVEEIYDPRNSASTSRRFYLNQIVAAEDAWVAPHEYDAMVGGETVEDLKDGEEGTLGFDGSKTDDHTVLIFCRLSDGYTFTLGNWDPEEHEGEAPRELIDGAVRNALERYTICAFFGDLAEWESYVDAWALDYGKTFEIKATAKHAIAWDMRGHQKEATIEIGRLHDEIEESAKAIREGRDPVFRHDGNPRTTQHFHNARRWPNTWGVTVRKEHRESKRKIDAVPATMLARMARRLVLANPKRRKKKTGKAAFV